MPTRAERVKEAIVAGNADSMLISLYGNRPGIITRQKGRYLDLIRRFQDLFPPAVSVDLFSSPGRTEIGGNHTDHNAGKVLAAAVDLDIIAAAAANDRGCITIESEGHSRVQVDLDQLAPQAEETLKSPSLVRGICSGLRERGYRIGGFDAVLKSDVLRGSGLSSSAAFETLVVAVLNHLYNAGAVPPIEAAKIGQYAENEFFGKPSGLMDQMACAVGGFVAIDFKSAAEPLVERVEFDLGASVYKLVIVNTGGSHADLHEDYAGLPREMRSVAAAFGGHVLREFSLRKVLDNVAALREKVGDRAILRAMHFYRENQRVVGQVEALRSGDFPAFLRLVIDSGRSSWMLCQNCYSPANPLEQGISLALAVSEEILRGKGAWRVHGGGFAGTIQAFAPDSLLAEYLRTMRGIFGEQSCYELNIRSAGATMVKLAVE